MSDAPRLAIAAIETRLQAITVVNGYNTNAGNQVHLGLRGFDAEAETFPQLSIASGQEQVEELTARRYRCRREIRISGYVEDVSAPTVALEYLIEDVQRAMEQSDETLGGLVHFLGYEGLDVNEPREDGGAVSSMVISYVIEYDRSYGQ